jgi:hypothetical protein
MKTELEREVWCTHQNGSGDEDDVSEEVTRLPKSRRARLQSERICVHCDGQHPCSTLRPEQLTEIDVKQHVDPTTREEERSNKSPKLWRNLEKGWPTKYHQLHWQNAHDAECRFSQHRRDDGPARDQW